MSLLQLARVPIVLALCVTVSGCDDSVDRESAEVVVSDGGVPRRSVWRYWDRGGDLGTAWRASSFDDATWASGTGPLGYGESYLATTIGYGGDAAHKHVTTYFRTQFTVSDPGAVRAIRGELMFDDGIVVYLNGQEIGRDSMPAGPIAATTLASGHEANNAYSSFDWTAQKPLLRAGVNTLAVEVHQQSPSSSDLVFDLGLVLDLAPAPVAGDIPRGSTWSYWDRGGDLGTAWRAGSYDASSWARGAGPLGYGESYLRTTIGYGGNATAKHITSYFRIQFTVTDPGAVRAMVGELMYDDGVVVYLNGHELGRASMPAGTITASTLASGHEANNTYVSYDWTASRALLVAGVNTIAVEVHQQSPSSSDLVFDLSLTLDLAPPPPASDDLPRGSVWTYWDRGGDLGTAWRTRSFDAASWATGAGPLGYGEPYVRTVIGYGGDPDHKHITTYFRGTLVIEDPEAVTSLIAGVMHDDGFVVYINGQELTRFAMPAGTITASTLASNWESGNVYEAYDWTAAAVPLLVPGVNLIAVEVHQAAPTSSDLTFDLELTVETASRQPTERGIPSGSTWGYWDRGGDLGTAWRAPDYPETGWTAGPAPLGFGESYLATRTAAGPITTYFRHDFTRGGSPSEWVLEAMYDDGFVAYLNGTEVLRVGLPAGPITASTLASNHEAAGFQRFALPNASSLVVEGLNTLAIEVHQSSATSSDLVWDARLIAESPWPVAWTRQDSGTTRFLHEVWFTDALHGWAVGEWATLLRTTDGGVTWTPQQTIDATDFFGSLFFAVEFADAQHGWIVGPSDKILTTTDGGATWSVDSRVAARDLSFISVTTGWLAGPHIYRTNDGGATWQLQLASDGNIEYHTIDFVDANHGWAVGRVESGGGGFVNGQSIVIHTSDGGATWQQQLGVGDWERAINALDAVTSSFACAVGIGSAHTQLGEFKLVTRDSGATWQPVPDSPNGASLWDVQFIDQNVGWAVGYAGSIIHTEDGGATWTVQETARWEDIPDHTLPTNPSLHGVHFIDSQHGWAVGVGGTILTTSNGGR